MGEKGNLDLLRLVGEALYGERWQAPIACDLGVSDRAVRYWLSAANRSPDDLDARLLSIVQTKHEALGGLQDVIRERISQRVAPNNFSARTAQANEGS